MFVNPKKWIITAGLIAAPLQAMAAVETASFGSANNATSNSFVVQTGTTTINVSGWSDTSNVSGDGPGDNTIRSANVVRYGSGWGAINQDQGSGQPAHSADNMNSGGSNGTSRDYDFFLLDFGAKSVTLNSAIFSWRHNSTAQNQVSFAALDATQFNSNVNGNTVSDLLSSSPEFGSSQMNWRGNNGNQFQSIGNYYADTGLSATSSLWIVSAYNQAFGAPSSGASNYNDGFKLAGISFSTLNPSTIPEPSTIAILGLALCGLTLRKRKNS